MSQILLIAALVAALVASALGFDLISTGEQVRLALAWGFLSAALVILAGLVGDR